MRIPDFLALPPERVSSTQSCRSLPSTSMLARALLSCTTPSTMHYLDRLHRPSFGAIRWVRIRSPKCAKHRQHSLGIDKAAESTMLRELSGAPDLGELIKPGSVFFS